MANRGWQKPYYDVKFWHYVNKKKVDWPEYPRDDGKGDGWHSTFTTACGLNAGWVRGKNPKMDFVPSLPKRARPCIRCLVILAREKKII